MPSWVYAVFAAMSWISFLVAIIPTTTAIASSTASSPSSSDRLTARFLAAKLELEEVVCEGATIEAGLVVLIKREGVWQQVDPCDHDRVICVMTNL